VADRSTCTAGKLKQLRCLLRGKRTLLVVLQDNPDPDAIAAGVALRQLVNFLLRARRGQARAVVKCSIAHGGIVGRAENQALARYLTANLRRLHEINPAAFDLVALVDTQPGTGNNSLSEGARVDIVIDHHPVVSATQHVPFTDIRKNYGATSTILFQYLREAGVPIHPPLATGLLYGIRSDTQDLGRQATRADIEAHAFLYARANSRMLGYITHSGLPEDYFQLLHRSLLNARRYGTGIITSLGNVGNSDMIGEVADLLLRDDKAHWSLAYGVWRGILFLSLRTDGRQGNADKVVRRIVAGLGTGGGHDMMAGGQIPLPRSNTAARRLENLARRRFLRATGQVHHRGRPLVHTS